MLPKLPKIEKLIRQLWQWRIVWIAAPAIATLVIAVNAAGWLQTLELASLDLLFCLRPKEAPDPRIVIVTIDEADIKQVGQWPMSDAVLSQLIENIKQQQPRAIALNLYRDLPVEPGNQQLVETFKSTPNLIGVDKIIGDIIDPPPTLQELQQVGMNDFILDVDGKVRRVLMSHKDRQNNTRLSLGALLSLMYLETQGIDLEMIDPEQMHLGLGNALFMPLNSHDGGYVRTNTGGYQILLNYRASLDDFYTISMTDVLENQIPSDLIPGENDSKPLSDRIVVIGSIAPSLKDFFFTPYNSSLFANSQPMPGIVIHANLIGQVISAALDGRPLIRVWSELIESSWIIFWSFVGATVVWRFRSSGSRQQNTLPAKALIGLILASLGVIGSGYLAFLASWWIPVIRPLLSVLGSGMVLLVYHNQQLQRENEKRLIQFLEAVPVGIAVVDRKGHPYFVNQKGTDLLGKGVISNTHLDEFSEVYQNYIAGSDRLYPTEKLPIFRALQGESSTVDDLEIHRDQQRIPLEAWGTPIYNYELSKITYAIVAFQDISERKKAEADRKAFTEQLLRLNQAYERFVPNQFLHLLNKTSIIEVQLGEAVQKTITILFSDIREFTTLSEKLSPVENFNFINSYLSCMEPAINQNNGFIDKYIGDAIMALFPGTADDAVKAGISMLKFLETYNQKQPIGTKPIKIGIGINTGSMMLGTVGGVNRMDSTVISDAVNLGSRVESLTKNYGVSLLIAEYTLLELEDPSQYSMRLIDRVKVKGKSEPVTVYEVFDADSPEIREAKLATKTDFEKGILFYHFGYYTESEKILKKCQFFCQNDEVINVYLNRLDAQ